MEKSCIKILVTTPFPDNAFTLEVLKYPICVLKDTIVVYNEYRKLQNKCLETET